MSPASDALKPLHDPDANPLRVADLLDTATRKTWRDWLPEQVEDYVGGLSVQGLDKAMAVQVGLTNHDAFEDWTVFNSCVIAFNGRRVNFESLDVPTVPELAWGCTVLRGLHPQAAFGSDVERFVGSVMALEGLVFFPWTGGKGIALGLDGAVWANGLMDTQSLASEVRNLWEKIDGEIAHATADEADPVQAQLAKLLRAKDYVSAQQPRSAP